MFFNALLYFLFVGGNQFHVLDFLFSSIQPFQNRNKFVLNKKNAPLINFSEPKINLNSDIWRLTWNCLATSMACSRASILWAAPSVKLSNRCIRSRSWRSIALRSFGSAPAATSLPMAANDDMEFCLSSNIFFKNCATTTKIKIKILQNHFNSFSQPNFHVLSVLAIVL